VGIITEIAGGGGWPSSVAACGDPGVSPLDSTAPFFRSQTGKGTS
jgi:hypothetical protein